MQYSRLSYDCVPTEPDYHKYGEIFLTVILISVGPLSGHCLMSGKSHFAKWGCCKDIFGRFYPGNDTNLIIIGFRT